jgi:hypothetical protein
MANSKILTEENYWDEVWKDHSLPQVIKVKKTSIIID